MTGGTDAAVDGAITVTTEVEGVTVTVTVHREGRSHAPPRTDEKQTDGERADARRFALGGGRTLPNLLFVTNFQRLGEQIGLGEADLARRLVRDAGQGFLDVTGTSPAAIAGEIAQQLQAAADPYVGVVLLGGYHVIPAFTVDSLTPAAQERGVRRASDLDHYFVWSDDPFVDLDGDLLPDLPISRIADGRSPLLFFAQLSATPVADLSLGGLRNLHRPFAERIASSSGLPPARNPALVSCAPANSAAFSVHWMTDAVTYLMLHGSDADGTRLWGEDAQQRPLETVAIGQLPEKVGGTFFSGCCWGGLIADATARDASTGRVVADRTEKLSFALALLVRGALAFVGCTGSHYSPKAVDAHTYGAPFHAEFFAAMRSGSTPAQATQVAKRHYAADYLAQVTNATELSYSNKILHTFTCLGLGW